MLDGLISDEDRGKDSEGNKDENGSETSNEDRLVPGRVNVFERIIEGVRVTVERLRVFKVWVN